MDINPTISSLIELKTTLAKKSDSIEEDLTDSNLY